VLHEDCYEIIFAPVGLVDLVRAYVLSMTDQPGTEAVALMLTSDQVYMSIVAWVRVSMCGFSFSSGTLDISRSSERRRRMRAPQISRRRWVYSSRDGVWSRFTFNCASRKEAMECVKRVSHVGEMMDEVWNARVICGTMLCRLYHMSDKNE